MSDNDDEDALDNDELQLLEKKTKSKSVADKPNAWSTSMKQMQKQEQ